MKQQSIHVSLTTLYTLTTTVQQLAVKWQKVLQYGQRELVILHHTRYSRNTCGNAMAVITLYELEVQA